MNMKNSRNKSKYKRKTDELIVKSQFCKSSTHPFHQFSPYHLLVEEDLSLSIQQLGPFAFVFCSIM